jgi:hypothetical protein
MLSPEAECPGSSRVYPARPGSCRVVVFQCVPLEIKRSSRRTCSGDGESGCSSGRMRSALATADRSRVRAGWPQERDWACPALAGAVPLVDLFQGARPGQGAPQESGRSTRNSRTARRCRCPPWRPRLYQRRVIGQPWCRPQNRDAGDDSAWPGATGQHSHSATGRERDQDRCIGRCPHSPGAKSG